VTRRPFVLGRDPACDLQLQDEKVSRRHTTIEVFGDSHGLIRDLDSTNGTFVDEARIDEPHPITPGQRFRVGDTVLELVAEPAPPAPAAVDPAAQSLIRRLVLERKGTRRAMLIAIGAAALALVLVAVVALTGVFGSGDTTNAKPTVADIVQAVRPSTALVVSGTNGQATASGTGWVLDASRGFIVTNHHVVNAGNEYVVMIGNRRRRARIVGTAPCEDLALLKVDDTAKLRTLDLGSQSKLRLGDSVVALGFPESASADNNLTATSGVVSVVRTSFSRDAVRTVDVPEYPNVVQTDTPINPGNSGGPLVDFDKNLVGVNSAGITLLGGRTIQGQAYAIGVDRVRQVMTTLRKRQSIGWTGLGLLPVADPANLTRLGLPPTPGLLLASAVPGTPAAKAGLGRSPGLVTAINGRAMDGTIPTYCDAIGAGRSGTNAVFSIISPGSTTPIDVRLTFA
jgi:S1-C subfamily serine protease